MSVCLSGAVFLSVGLPVSALWGTRLTDPVTLSPPWPRDSAAARVLSVLLFVANLVSYCLDSVRPRVGRPGSGQQASAAGSEDPWEDLGGRGCCGSRRRGHGGA